VSITQAVLAVMLYGAATHKHMHDLQHALVANNVLMQAAVVFSPSCIAAVAIGNHANTGSKARTSTICS
jgi:hypothetical protein